MGKVKKKQKKKKLKWDELSEGGKMHLERRARNVCKGFLGSDAIRTNDRYEFKSYLLAVQEAEGGGDCFEHEHFPVLQKHKRLGKQSNLPTTEH